MQQGQLIELGHELGCEVAVEGLVTALAAVAAFLDAAERRLCNGKSQVVDRHHARLEPA